MQLVDIFPFKVNFQLIFFHVCYYAPIYLFLCSTLSDLFLNILVKLENSLQILFGLSLPNKHLSYIFISFSVYRVTLPFLAQVILKTSAF